MPCTTALLSWFRLDIGLVGTRLRRVDLLVGLIGSSMHVRLVGCMTMSCSCQEERSISLVLVFELSVSNAGGTVRRNTYMSLGLLADNIASSVASVHLITAGFRAGNNIDGLLWIGLHVAAFERVISLAYTVQSLHIRNNRAGFQQQMQRGTNDRQKMQI